MRKQRTYAEVYNDLDGEVVNLFRVLRDPAKAAWLENQIRLTPFARAEFRDAYLFDVAVDDVETARRTIIKSFMGLGSDALRDAFPRGMRTRASTHAVSTPTGFRSDSNRSGTTPAHDWMNYPDQIRFFCERLAGVVIEQSDAAAIIRQHDTPETLIYCDPPYVHTTRRPLKKGSGGGYRHEMSDDQHRALAETLHAVDGMVVISNYPCDLYASELYPSWECFEKRHLADGARKRVEMAWINPACRRGLDLAQGRLFDA